MDNFVNFFQIYLLIMVRFMAILMVAPLFSSNVIPNTIKIGLSFVATAAINIWFMIRNFMKFQEMPVEIQKILFRKQCMPV